MGLAKRRAASVGRTVVAGVKRRWEHLDTDWKSVIWGLCVMLITVGFDVQIPN